MKIKKEFAPVTIVLETKEDLEQFKLMMSEIQNRTNPFGQRSEYANLAAMYLNQLK